jgi:hypothetical protein
LCETTPPACGSRNLGSRGSRPASCGTDGRCSASRATPTGRRPARPARRSRPWWSSAFRQIAASSLQLARNRAAPGHRPQCCFDRGALSLGGDRSTQFTTQLAITGHNETILRSGVKPQKGWKYRPFSIRHHGTGRPSPTFKTGALSHSATLPTLQHQ